MAILAGFLATFTIGGFMALEGHLNVGAYGVLVFSDSAPVVAINQSGADVDLFRQAMASTRRILNLMETPIAVRDEGTQVPATPMRGEVRLSGINFQYAAGSGGVLDIDLAIPSGTTLALVGATGSGKSTLIAVTALLSAPVWQD